MKAPMNGWEPVSPGRIKMETTSFLMSSLGMASAINQDAEVPKESVPEVVKHVCSIFGIVLDKPVAAPRHGFKVSTLVGHIHAHQKPRDPAPETPP